MPSTHEQRMSDSQMSMLSQQKNQNGCRLLVWALVVCLISLVVGLLIGWFGHQSSVSPPGSSDRIFGRIVGDGPEEIRQKIFDEVKPKNIEMFLRRWTEFPHLAGTDGEHRLAEEIADTWRSQGLDNVSTVTYNVLLSFPNTTVPSMVQIINTDTQTPVHTSKIKERVLEPGRSEDDVVQPYNGFSYPGDVRGPLVYVNYGRLEDFRYLQSINISVTGCIAIARYGKIFRGDKAKFAERYGAIGMIIYTDPYDYSDLSQPPYPDSWWLPETGVQRGTIFGQRGDPLTPGYPSKDYGYRLPEDEADIPRIPVHPISYGDALALLSRMNGASAPQEWQGNLNITYRYGPGFTDSTLTTRLLVTTINKRADTKNVFGYINGSIEPDRYVLVGNHYDSWVLGAVDPTSGTSTMMELSRVLSKLVQQGWRPRRTIVFCAWGAEEFGLIGSFEWTEEFVQVLQDRAVVYLNVDSSTSGNDSLRASGAPMVHDALYDAAKLIPTPNSPSKSLYEEWLNTFPGKDLDGLATGKPAIGRLGSGSDYDGFQALCGISSADFRYKYGPRYKVSSYPLYHSAYETFDLVKKYIDPEFKYAAAVAKYWGELTRYFADSYVLPLNVSKYPEVLKDLVTELENGYGTLLANQNIHTDYLHAAVLKFENECRRFEERLKNADYNNPMLIKSLNDQLMMVERAFTDPHGLPTRPIYRHVIFASSMHDAYSGASFPGLVDLMFEIDKAPDPEKQWNEVKKHFAAIVFSIHSAAAVLKEPTLFS